jgi:hypothetical protein
VDPLERRAHDPHRHRLRRLGRHRGDGAAILGVVLLREPITPTRAGLLVRLVVSIVELELTAPVAPR